MLRTPAGVSGSCEALDAPRVAAVIRARRQLAYSSIVRVIMSSCRCTLSAIPDPFTSGSCMLRAESARSCR
eukprot:6539256-Prymnesium_polylepis.1